MTRFKPGDKIGSDSRAEMMTILRALKADGYSARIIAGERYTVEITDDTGEEKPMEGRKSVCGLITEACDEICLNYCKWMEEYQHKDAADALYEEKCESCPIAKLLD